MYDIAIPTYGIKGITMIDKLLDSISKFDNPSLDNIIISDDGSTNDTVSKLTELKNKYKNLFNIIIVTNPSYHSFSKTVNSGMKISNYNNDILLLNNDMLALTTFEPFINYMKANNKIGIIGAKLLFPNGTIQSAGTVYMPLINRFRHNYKYTNYNYPPTNIARKHIAVTGACMYINHDLINKIGYFDEDYILSYEDTDYCLNAQYSNYEVWYIPDVVMIHYETSTRTDPYSDWNKNLFWGKWGKLYESIRSDQGIENDNLDAQVITASSLVGLGLMFRGI